MCKQKNYSFKCILKAKPYSAYSTTRGKDGMKNREGKDGATRYSLNQPGNPCHELVIK